MIVAILALIFAVAGTSVAAINSLSKKQKTQTRKIAKGEIAKAAPGLSVAEAAHAKRADTANLADAAKQSDTAKQADAVPAGSIGVGQLSASIPAAHVTRTAAQSIPAGTNTALQFNSERYDTADMHDDATNNERLTAPVAGIYEVTAQVAWAAGGNVEHELWIERNDATQLAITSDVFAAGQQTVTTQTRLAAGDFVKAFVFQDDAVARNVQLDQEDSPEFSMTWLAPGP
jgi:hypothetical protein